MSHPFQLLIGFLISSFSSPIDWFLFFSNPHFFFVVDWSQIGTDVINSTLHQSIQMDAALQSFVLLKNSQNVLPIKKGSTVAVVGPMGVTRFGMLSDYAGDEICFGNVYDWYEPFPPSFWIVPGLSTILRFPPGASACQSQAQSWCPRGPEASDNSHLFSLSFWV